MLRRKFIRARSYPRRLGRYQAGNPLWPLEELHDLHKPPFVAEPEFTPFDIDALRCNPQSVPALPGAPPSAASMEGSTTPGLKPASRKAAS